MTVVWFIVAVVAIYFGVVVFGSVLLRAVILAAAIVWSPFHKIARLYKSNQKKKAFTLAASIAFALSSVSLLVWLLVAIP